MNIEMSGEELGLVVEGLEALLRERVAALKEQVFGPDWTDLEDAAAGIVDVSRLHLRLGGLVKH